MIHAGAHAHDDDATHARRIKIGGMSGVPNHSTVMHRGDPVFVIIRVSKYLEKCGIMRGGQKGILPLFHAIVTSEFAWTNPTLPSRFSPLPPVLDFFRNDFSIGVPFVSNGYAVRVDANAS